MKTTRIYKLMVEVEKQLILVGRETSYHRAHAWAQKNENRWVGVRVLR
jgi:hypothetical protein